MANKLSTIYQARIVILVLEQLIMNEYDPSINRYEIIQESKNTDPTIIRRNNRAIHPTRKTGSTIDRAGPINEGSIYHIYIYTCPKICRSGNQDLISPMCVFITSVLLSIQHHKGFRYCSRFHMTFAKNVKFRNKNVLTTQPRSAEFL